MNSNKAEEPRGSKCVDDVPVDLEWVHEWERRRYVGWSTFHGRWIVALAQTTDYRLCLRDRDNQG